MTIREQMEKASKLRCDTLQMIHTAGSGHPGGSLSVLEILMALYYNVASIDPKKPDWEERDRIVLSKGHAAPALYAILADLGFFPQEDMQSFRQLHSHLQGHPDMHKTPGVDMSTGSLGQGVAVAGGLALAAKQKGANWQVYAIIGDGEAQEGIVWEAAMSASHYKLDNLTVLMDHNGLQIDGTNAQVMSIDDIVAKYEAFGFHCQTVDGHDIQALVEALQLPVQGKPKFINCTTKKGNGVSFMSDRYDWHGKAPGVEDYQKAIEELRI